MRNLKPAIGYAGAGSVIRVKKRSGRIRIRLGIRTVGFFLIGFCLFGPYLSYLMISGLVKAGTPGFYILLLVNPLGWLLFLAQLPRIIRSLELNHKGELKIRPSVKGWSKSTLVRHDIEGFRLESTTFFDGEQLNQRSVHHQIHVVLKDSTSLPLLLTSDEAAAKSLVQELEGWLRG